MTQRKVTCPTCAKEHRTHPVLTRSTPWTDECACSDGVTCLYHQHHLMDPAPRCTEEELERRRRIAELAEHERFNALEDKIGEALNARRRLTIALAKLEAVREWAASHDTATSDDLQQLDRLLDGDEP